jgi:uncharacterized protein
MTRILLFLIAAFALVWLLRRSLGRRPDDRAAPPPNAVQEPQPIVACAQCGVHLPSNEALPGRGGVFCGEAHRAAFERDHPGAT